MSTCEICGAAVSDVAKHDQWHSHVDDVQATADDALDRAEQAHNVLYQNNIQV
jgi:hypothetical protein